jgi:uncharacterized protein YjbI with pentapeptide repeats
MGSREHLDRLVHSTSQSWNAWRLAHLGLRPDLSKVDLSGRNLDGFNLFRADLSGSKLANASLAKAVLERAVLVNAFLSGSNLQFTDLRGADLSGAQLTSTLLVNAILEDANLEKASLRLARMDGAFLPQASLRDASLAEANLEGAILNRADLSGADLQSANLRGVSAVRAVFESANLYGSDLAGADLTLAVMNRADLRATNLHMTNLTGAVIQRADLQAARAIMTVIDEAVIADCSVYGISTWDLKGTPSVSQGLVVSRPDQPQISVDDLKVAQFIYLLVDNPSIRDILNTVTGKVILILGRFTPLRKKTLDALRDRLRQIGYVPVLFDFRGPEDLNTTEAVALLARMARFVIADISEPSSIPHELATIIPTTKVPVRIIRQDGADTWSMARDLLEYDWVIRPILRYRDVDALLENLEQMVLKPVEAKRKEIAKKRIEIDEEWL